MKSSDMGAISVESPRLVLLTEGENSGSKANARGHLFEKFMARVMKNLGYDDPTPTNLNVKSDGIELDISMTHHLDRTKALAECKAYSTNVDAARMLTFYGKLTMARLVDSDNAIRGFFFVTPRLTSDAKEAADKLNAKDPLFRVLDASDIWRSLIERKTINPITSGLIADHAIVVHESGVYTAAYELDPVERVATRVLVRGGTNASVPSSVLSLLGDDAYSQGLPVSSESAYQAPLPFVPSVHAPTVVRVQGSTSDFEYQLPASPQYFVGRRAVVRELVDHVDDRKGPFVLNAQSGWGKSSLALMVASKANSEAFVFDTRTANSSAYVAAAIRQAALELQSRGRMEIPSSANWASVSGALATISEATWNGDASCLIIFDQFENAFADAALTAEFRDAVMWNREHRERITFGFAWKTDYVDWIENHPYRLRDQIRDSAKVVNLKPFGSQEVNVVLERLQAAVDVALTSELKRRLREYGQGLPWLIKKLAGHVIVEIDSGKSPEQLVGEALNVQNLFDSDLAALSPDEREALNFVARYAPVPAKEASEKFDKGLMQSLLDQRLVVQVGEKLDTYWDIFRDYLTTGRVPIEDSYILRQSPNSVSRLVPELLNNQGVASTAEIAKRWETTENVVWNSARDLRQLGLASLSSGRLSLAPEILEAEDAESALRGRVAKALRRHRAYSEILKLTERGQGSVTIGSFASRLQEVFPAVQGTDGTWKQYANTFVAWLEYAALAVNENGSIKMAGDGAVGKGKLTTRQRRGGR